MPTISRIGVSSSYGPVAPDWMRLPSGDSPGKNLSANAWLTISTRGWRWSSSSVKSRPLSSGVPIVVK